MVPQGQNFELERGARSRQRSQGQEERDKTDIIAQKRIHPRPQPQLPQQERVFSRDSSKHANLKELRFDADNGVWRVAFAFDPKRRAVLLVAGDKSVVAKIGSIGSFCESQTSVLTSTSRA